MNLLALLVPGTGAVFFIYATKEHFAFHSEMDAFDWAESRGVADTEYVVVSRQSFASSEDIL